MSHGRSRARNKKYDATTPLPPAVEEACTRAAEGFGAALAPEAAHSSLRSAPGCARGFSGAAAEAPSATAAHRFCDPPAEPGADKKGMAEDLPIWVPPGHLTLLLGNPGVGKSLVALDLAARLSRMKVPRSSIILSLEDTRETLKTRLAAAGAFTKHIYLPTPEQVRRDLSLVPERPMATPFGDSDTDPSPLIDWLTINLSALPNVGLLVLDPLPAFLWRHDSYHQGAVRSMLDPLLELAEQYKIAVLGVTHLNKSAKSRNPLHRAIGSLAYTVLARTIHLVDYHTRWRVGGRRPESLARMPRLVIPLKSNLAPIAHATVFDITERGSIHWHESAVMDHPLLSLPEPSADPVPQSELDFACDFLMVTLADGPLVSAELRKLALAEGISKRTYERARCDLRIRPYHEPGTNIWRARLPGDFSDAKAVGEGI